jgi:hypothetical protein
MENQMNTVLAPHIITAENAEKIAFWLKERGGIFVWKSVNLSNPGASWTTPATNADGSPVTKPIWEAESVPSRHIDSADEIVVSKDEEISRFHVALRMGSQGFSIKVSDGGSRRIGHAVAKAGEGAYYVFDGQDAVIMRPISQVPLLEFLRGKS